MDFLGFVGNGMLFLLMLFAAVCMVAVVWAIVIGIRRGGKQ